jgi:hypothetical protein
MPKKATPGDRRRAFLYWGTPWLEGAGTVWAGRLRIDEIPAYTLG